MTLLVTAVLVATALFSAPAFGANTTRNKAQAKGLVNCLVDLRRQMVSLASFDQSLQRNALKSKRGGQMKPG